MSTVTMSIVIAGHVDHGKSTVIGRLLVDTESLPQGKLDQVKERCRRTSKPFEYAFLLDALRDEQAQGITIDSARVFFRSKRRNYLIIDAPGHIEFLKNMITGASRAKAALLVIDAAEGMRENSRRHGYMLALLGVRQVAVLVNKMDLAGYREERFREIAEECDQFLRSVGVQPLTFIPVSGLAGQNIARPATEMPWYDGVTVLELLDSLEPPTEDEGLPFRMPVQDVFKFTALGDQRRIIAGTIASGKLQAGDELIFCPSGKRSRVSTLESFPAGPLDCAAAAETVGFTLDEQLYVTRGQVACRQGEYRPKVDANLRVSLFWLGRAPMRPGRRYLLRAGTAKVEARLERVIRLIDASTLENLGIRSEIARHDVAECIIVCDRAIAFDVEGELAETSRFVIVDDHEIQGGGIVLGPAADVGSGTSVPDSSLHGNDRRNGSRPPRPLLPEPADPALKSLGILAESRPGLFTVRSASPLGLLCASQLRALAEIAERYGEGRVHLTARQSPEIIGVPYDNLPAVLEGLAAAGLHPAASGSRVRTIVGCLGCEVNAHGLIATQDLGRSLDERLRGSECPAKLKIALAGCPNDCPRAKATDIGLVGTVRPLLTSDLCTGCGGCLRRCRQGALSFPEDGGVARIDEKLCLGCGLCAQACRAGAIRLDAPRFSVYVGGQHGRHPRLGRRLPGSLSAEAASDMIDSLLHWYRENGRRGERLGATLERLGEDVLDGLLV